MEEGDKGGKITQKERRRIEVQKRKFRLEQERVLKPGECNKYIKAVIHNKITEELAGSRIIQKLTELDMKAEITSSATPNTITWKRQINQKIITEEGKIIQFDDVEKDEPYLLIILMADEFAKAVKESQLMNIVQSAQELCPTEAISTTLVVYGLKNYCRKNKNKIGMKETEIKLTQLQILANCSHRLHETPDDLALTVSQISKAIAEEPFKSKQNHKLDQEQLFLCSDVKVNVVENDPDSYARLWNAQLNCLPKVTFDVAQSISKEYSMPRKLIEAYKTCDNKNQMLADIQIIKTGPLSKYRRIGPELSKKIATLLTSNNPEDLL